MVNIHLYSLISLLSFTVLFLGWSLTRIKFYLYNETVGILIATLIFSGKIVQTESIKFLYAVVLHAHCV